MPSGEVSDGLSDDWNMMMSLAACCLGEGVRKPLLVLPPHCLGSRRETREEGHVITYMSTCLGRENTLLQLFYFDLISRCFPFLNIANRIHFINVYRRPGERVCATLDIKDCVRGREGREGGPASKIVSVFIVTHIVFLSLSVVARVTMYIAFMVNGICLIFHPPIIRNHAIFSRRR